MRHDARPPDDGMSRHAVTPDAGTVRWTIVEHAIQILRRRVPARTGARVAILWRHRRRGPRCPRWGHVGAQRDRCCARCPARRCRPSRAPGTPRRGELAVGTHMDQAVLALLDELLKGDCAAMIDDRRALAGGRPERVECHVHAASRQLGMDAIHRRSARRAGRSALVGNRDDIGPPQRADQLVIQQRGVGHQGAR